MEGAPIVIVIDTREKTPLHFPLNGILTEVRREKLQIGDYGAVYTNGRRAPIAFERKSLSDLFGTLGKGYPRFRRRLMESQDRGLTLILLIEGTVSDVVAGVPHSYRAGEEVLQQLFTLWLRYGLLPVFAPTRREAARFVRETFEVVGREMMK